MKPATPDSVIASGNGSIAAPFAGSGAATSSPLGAAFRKKGLAPPETPTITLSAAARTVDFAIPRYGIANHAATKHATADPSVFTKYSTPTDRPTLPERFTRCATSSGSVAPISTVGISTSANDNRPVCIGGAPAVIFATP